MELMVIDAETVERVLPMTEAMAAMREAFTRLSAGAVAQPPRQVLRAPDRSALAVMPALVEGAAGERAVAGLKAMAIQPANPARGLPAHHGLVVVFDPVTGVPAAVVDAAAVTAIRTAAASAVATEVLADPDASVLAVLGAGVQARSHLTAMAAVRALSGVRVWSRNPDRAERLAAWATRELGVPASARDRAAAATAGADLICTTTSSAEPILGSADVPGGAHINAVGASFAHTRELTAELVCRAAVFVDGREAARHDAGDLLAAAGSGFRFDDIRGEIGEVLLGRVPGRPARRDAVTLFKSVGLAVQDVLAARYVWQRARDAGLGATVPMRSASGARR
jgi:ornithine cyclodeaminase